MGPSPAAVAAPAPALDPPVVVSLFQGLRVMPVSGQSPSPFQPNSGVVVLPSMTPPACLRRRTTGGPPSGTPRPQKDHPDNRPTPRVRGRALMGKGRPRRGTPTPPPLPARPAPPAAARRPPAG